jgi:hypothetical protein
VKKYGNTEKLQEWAHQASGTKQIYEALLDSTDKDTIRRFLEGFLKAQKISRNDRCYCGSGKKSKFCHYDSALFLKSTPKKEILMDIELFN